MSDTGGRNQTPEIPRDTDATDTLSVSEQCELLASDRRRAMLRYLTARPGETVDRDELVEFLLAHGEETDRQNIVISLQHVHLPKLADAGVIAYRPNRGQLTYRGARANSDSSSTSWRGGTNRSLLAVHLRRCVLRRESPTRSPATTRRRDSTPARRR
jgi:hypothetical protein